MWNLMLSASTREREVSNSDVSGARHLAPREMRRLIKTHTLPKVGILAQIQAGRPSLKLEIQIFVCKCCQFFSKGD